MVPYSLVEMFSVSGERYCLHEGDVTFQKTAFFVTIVVRALSLMKTPLHNVSLVHCGRRQKVLRNFHECLWKWTTSHFSYISHFLFKCFMFWLWGCRCFDCGAVGGLIVRRLMFWLWGSWCFDCWAVDILIVAQFVFWLSVGLCFDCGAVSVFDCGAVDVLIVG